MLAFKHGELLAKSQVLRQQASASTEDARECAEPEPEQVDRDGKVMADGILVCAPMLLISKPDGIVVNDNARCDRLLAERSRTRHLFRARLRRLELLPLPAG